MGRIVLIDDEPRLLETLRRFLAAEGHEVRTASRFGEVEGGLGPGGFDVLVTDIIMPEHTGVDVLRILVGRGCHEPVILMTGEPNVGTAAEAVRLGAYDYVSKPITKRDIVSVVARALRHVQVVRERDRARLAEAAMLENLACIRSSTASLVDEFRDASSPVRAALHAASTELGDDTRSSLEDFARRMERLELLLEHTLAFAKPIVVDAERVDIGELLAAAVDEFRGADGIVIRFVPPPGGIHAEADRTLLRDLMRHLLRNAVEATGSRGRVDVAVSRSATGDVVVRVEDDGPGVADGERQRLFVPFETSKPSAVGIGLPIAKKIAEAHGGTIEVGRSAHGGARVTVVLPPAPAG